MHLPLRDEFCGAVFVQGFKVRVMLKVFKECCKNCLLSEDAIVSPGRRKDIVQGCVKNQTHFQCHMATIEGKDILCKAFFDKLGHYSQMVRISERLNMIEFVGQPEHERKPSYNDMKRR